MATQPPNMPGMPAPNSSPESPRSTQKRFRLACLRGKYDVLVVHKIDRFSRKLRVTLEYVEKLGRAGVGFVSILNQYDYSRPEGKFMLVMMGGLAELYSDNLSEEIKKGLDERRAQGYYCGTLPFGVG